MTAHDIDKLLADIATFKAADKAYQVYVEKQANGGLVKGDHGLMTDADKRRLYALQALQGDWLDTAAQFTALADHCAQLTRERDALAARIERAEGTRDMLRATLKNIANNAPQSEPSRTINYGNAAAIAYAFWYAGVIANNALTGAESEG